MEKQFRLPRYNEIPDVGLYLEQVVKFVNLQLNDIGCSEITSSMVSNYVKHKYIEKPVKKQYGRDHIVYILVIALIKNVLSMDNITTLFELQKNEYPVDTAYNYFCDKLESKLISIYEKEDNEAVTDEKGSESKYMLKSVVTATAHIIFLSNCFEKRSDRE